MELFKKEISGHWYDAPDELSQEEANLLAEAREAMSRAYAPYSEFRVGAALLLGDGVIITGNNQENAAFPSGLCAERVAFFSASSLYPGALIIAAAIVGSTDNFHVNHPVTPCGACRQVMLEYELNQDTSISLLMQGESGRILRIEGVRQLLPLFFHEPGLRQGKA
jgi:cytidine deaminase